MSTQSFLFLFFLAAMVVLSTITTPAIAGDDLQEPLSHRCRKRPPIGSPAPSPAREFILDDEEAIFEPLRHKHKPCPAPSPASEFELEDAELEVVEEDVHEVNMVKRMPPTKAPVQPPKAPVQPPKAPVQPPKSQPLRHRKNPPSPSPSPAPSPKEE